MCHWFKFTVMTNASRLVTMGMTVIVERSAKRDETTRDKIFNSMRYGDVLGNCWRCDRSAYNCRPSFFEQSTKLYPPKRHYPWNIHKDYWNLGGYSGGDYPDIFLHF